MTIKEGYNSKELEIRIQGSKNQLAELWIEQHGLPESCSGYKVTLSYVSLQELLELKREIEDAILVIAGIDRE